MVDKAEPLSMTKRCALLDLPRSMFYHTPQPVSGESYRLKGKNAAGIVPTNIASRAMLKNNDIA
jgi:hypothetical protein